MSTKDYDVVQFIKLVKEDRIQEALDYKNNGIPEYLYKYYSFSNYEEDLHESKMKTLRGNEIYFSPIDNFNDPYEFKAEYIDEKKFNDTIILDDGEKYSPGYAAACLRHGFNYAGTRFSSFSVKDFDLPMWAYYSDGFCGFCVKYKVVNKDKFFKVEYLDSKITSYSLYSLFEDNLKNHLMVAQLFSLKHIGWQHEEEYRVVIHKPSDIEDGFAVDCAQIGIEPVEILVGCKCAKKNIDELKDIVFDLNRTLNVSLKQMIVKANDYGFYTEDIK